MAGEKTDQRFKLKNESVQNVSAVGQRRSDCVFFAPQQSPLPGRSAVGNNHGLHRRLSSFGRKQFRNGLGNPDFSFKRFRYSGMRKAERAIQGLPAPA